MFCQKLFFLVLLFPFNIFAQHKIADSLENVLKQTKDEHQQIPLLNQLAFEYKGVDPLKTREYGNRAYVLASKFNDQRGQADALQKKGLSYYYLDSYDTALIYYHQSLSMANAAADSSLIAQAYSSIGNVFRLQGVNDTALKYLDRALHIYENLHDDKNIAACLSTIGDTYLFTSEFDKALEYHKRALEMAKKQNDKYREAFCLSSIANNYHMRGDFQNSIKYHEQVIAIAEPIGETSIVAGSLATIADAYSNLYNYPKAIETYLRALDIAEKKGDKHNTSYIYAGMSDIYQRQGDYKNAVKFLNKSISLSMQIGDYNRTCYGMLTMAEIKTEKKDTAGARKLIDEAIKMARQYNYPNNEATALRLKGALNYDEGHFALSENLLRSSLAIWDTIGDEQQQAETKIDLAKTLVALGKTDEAIANGEAGYALSLKLETPGLAMKASNVLVDAYEMKGDTKMALFYSKRLKTLSDSLNSAESTKKQTELFLQYQFDKEKEKANIVQEQKDAVAAAESRKQKFIIWSGTGILALVLGFAFFVYRSYRQKQKANEIITEQKKIVEEKNQEITDSINYAKNIQAAMLPPENSITELFPEHFVVFRPRDIVSGDFYWIGEREGLRFFAVADCTGHGVPGGFMSMLGITLLNEILAEKGILSPAEMLNELRNQIIQSLNHSRKDGETLARDGMDISICCVDLKNKKLKYAGANNALYIFRGTERIELSPDKQPVGAHIVEKPFTEKQIDLVTGDVIVAFSDGYADQFGGENGKKFMYKKFKESLLVAVQKPMKEAGEMMENEFVKWQADHAQVDDVCVFGIKITQ
jgi:serine phosphatase RsbU (regulator of sigma subunit)